MLIVPLSMQNQYKNTDLKFQSKEWVTAMDLNMYDFNLRMYDPVLARWHAADPMAQFANPYFAMNGNPVSTIDPTGGSGHAVQSGNIKASENEVTDYSMPLWDEGSPGGGSNGFGAHGYGSSYESGEAAWGSLFVDPGTESTMRGAAPCYDAMNNSYSYSDMVGAAVAQQYRCGGADNVNQATLNAYYNTNTSLAAIPEGTNLDITPSGGIGYYKNSEDVYTSGPGRSFTDGGWVELGGFGGGQGGSQVRPYFDALKANYELFTNMKVSEYYDHVGGQVQKMYNESAPNSCAIRLSEALNRVGVCIPKSNSTWSGSDGANYIYKVQDMMNFLTNTFGQPDVNSVNKADFMGTYGIILFFFSDGGNATGHGSLWDNNQSLYYEDFGRKDSKVYLWKMKK